jgi:hypothetical protein
MLQLLDDATTLTFDLNKQYTFFYHGDQVEQVV